MRHIHDFVRIDGIHDRIQIIHFLHFLPMYLDQGIKNLDGHVTMIKEGAMQVRKKQEMSVLQEYIQFLSVE